MSGSTSVRVQDWLDRLQAGDEGARAELINGVGRRLELMVRKALRRFPGVQRWEQTGDVLQNALLRVHRAIQLQVPSNARDFFGLASGLIRRELIDLLRHYQGPQGHGAHHASHPGGQSDSPADAAPIDLTYEPNQLARWTEFHESIDRLEPEKREVFTLVWYHGLELKEVAGLLGVGYSTVKRRWRETRLQLRAAFADKLLE